MYIEGVESIIQLIEKLVSKVGKLSSFLCFFLILLICLDVLMRYIFDFTLIWVIELEIYFFAILFLMGASYAFQEDKHVRVDVFYQNKSPKGKAWINLIGTIFFLLPWCLIIIWVSYNYAWFSWKMNEKSPQPGGLPALYVLKGFISISFFFLLLQAVANVLKSIQIIRGQ